MRFLFLNQYAPPDPAPTARLLGNLAERLRTEGHAVEIVSQSQDYQARPASGRSRLRRELGALSVILRAGWRVERPDVILALSSPPALLVVAAMLAWRHRAVLAHWAMDLYPELALVLGEIGDGLPFRITQRAMAWAYRRCGLVVALDEDMRDHLRARYGVGSRVLPPWPAPGAIAAIDRVLVPPEPSAQPWMWLYSGNLGRAHEWEPLLAIQAVLEGRGLPVRLVFQGDGAAREAARRRADALNLRSCVWKGYAPPDALVESLLAARVLIVTQRAVTRGLLWPSKLALIERLPRPVLWIGPADGAIARRLRARGDAGVFAPEEVLGAARWIEARYHTPGEPVPLTAPKEPAGDACATLAAWMAALRP